MSVQAQVLDLMMEPQADPGLRYLFISHDVVATYLGLIVERGPRHAVFEEPQPPYTQAPLKLVPIADPRRRNSEKDLMFQPIPSPIHPVGYVADPSVYKEVTLAHFVLTSDSRY